MKSAELEPKVVNIYPLIRIFTDTMKERAEESQYAKIDLQSSKQTRIVSQVTTIMGKN